MAAPAVPGLSKHIKAHLRDFFRAQPQHLRAVMRHLQNLPPDGALEVEGRPEDEDEEFIAWLGASWRLRPETGWATLRYLADRHLAGVFEDRPGHDGRPTYAVMRAAPWVDESEPLP